MPVLVNYSLRDPMRFATVSTVFGYVLPLLWTPVSGVVGVVLYILKLEWTALLPLLLGMCILSLLLHWVLFWLLELCSGKAQSMPPSVPADNMPPQGPALRHLTQLLLAITLMVTAIGVLHRLLGIGMLTVATLVAIPFSLAWSMALGHASAFARAAAGQVAQHLPRIADQFAIFLAAGFFVSAMHLSSTAHAVNQAFLVLHNALGTRVFLLAVPLMALAPAMLGVHPLVTIALLGESLQPKVLRIDVRLLALTLIGSSVLTYILGPFSGTLGLIQSITAFSSYQLAWWNLPYALLYYALLVTVILLYTL